MERKHSWTWLPARLNSLPLPHPKSTPKRRPPIAALEQLEDRVLLSTTGGGGTDAVLIGLLKTQVDIRTSAVNFLKVVEGICDGTQPELDAFLKITDAFHKIDSAVAALTTDALTNVGHKEDAAGQKFLEIKLQDVIISSFAKIDQELGAYGDGSVDKLLPAVQRIQDATNSYVAGLSTLPAVQHKELPGFLKIQNDLLKIDVILDVAAKIQDISITKPIDKSSDKLFYKLDEEFQKIDTAIIAVFGDGSVAQALKSDVDTYKGVTESLPILWRPARTTGGTTSVTVTTTTDIIT